MKAHILGLSENNVQLPKDMYEQLDHTAVVVFGRVEWAKMNEDLAVSCIQLFNSC